jgi:hypothetical protein
MSAARTCAFVLLENAIYMQRELPGLALDEARRARLEGLCEDLVGTKHDILTEVDELDELLTSDATEEVIATRVERIVRWLGEDVARLHEDVEDLALARETDPGCTAACVLVTESAANIVRAFRDVRAAAAREC